MKKIVLILTIMLFTASLAFGADLSEGFEGTFPPTDWTLDSTGPDNAPWDQSTTHHNGSYSARANCGGYGTYTNEWLITPRLDITTGDSISFWRKFKGGSSSYPDTLEILVSNDGMATWHQLAIATPDTTDDPDFVYREYDLSAYTGNNGYVAFRYASEWGYSSYIDDVAGPEVYAAAHDFATLDHATDSRSMQDTTVTAGSSVTFHIVAKNLGTTTESSPIKWTCTGGSPTSDTDETTGSLAQNATEHHTFSPTWTAPATSGKDTVYFYTELSGDANSGNDTTAVVITVCAPITSFPWTEGFEGGSIPDCWANLNDLWEIGTESHSGSYCAEVLYDHTGEAILTTPPINLPANYRIKFWWKDDDIAGKVAGHDTTYFEISTDGGSSWTTLDTLSAPSFMINYEEAVHDLSSYAGDGVYVRWRDVTDATFNAYGTGLDDITIEEIPSCPAPSALTETNITLKSAELNWMENGTATTWEYEYGVSPYSFTGTGISTGSKPVTLSGLTPGETYDWGVRADCGGSYSTWTNTGQFTTNDGKATYPDPADGATEVLYTATTLDWDDVTGADSYTIDIGTTTGGSDIVNDGACPTSQYTYGSNWDYNTQYFWTVTTVYTAKATVVGDEWDFTTEHDPSKLWESFTGLTFPPAGWTQKNLGDNTSGETWERTTSSTYYHTSPAGAYCYWGASGEAQDEWLITPKLEVRTGDKDFSFWYKTSTSFTETVKVRLSTTNTDTTSFSNTLFTLGKQSTWLKKESDLTSFINNDVYIAFQYLGTYDYPAAIDDVEGPTLFVGPPGAPTNPSPSNNDTGVSNTADLSWTNGYQTDNIDLYFSTDSSKVATKDASVRVITGQDVETYDPGTMAYSTKYFWKVICKNSAKAETDGPLWKFTVQDDPNYGQGTGTPLYYFANSLATGAPSHPSYSWIDISGTGTDVIGTVDGDSKVGGPYSIGFTFNFFGTDYTEFWIAADGYICFSSISSSEMTNQHIPSTSGVGNIVALFWDDMNPGDTDVLDRHIYYGTSGGNMVITYLHLPEYEYGADADGWITAQIILKPGGNVKLQYKEHGTSIDLNGATVGIENSSEDAGVEYHYNTDGGPIFSSPLAVEFGENENTLPVELIAGSLTAEYAINEYGSEYVIINWATASETDVNGFNIWRNTENNFSTAIQVNPDLIMGHGTTSEPHQYTYNDESIMEEELHAGDIYYYWLEVVDLGGTSSYSDAFEFVVPDDYEPSVPPELPLKIGLYQNCPNPFNPTLEKTKICFYLEEGTNANVEIKVYNIKGELVKTIWNQYTEFEKHPVPAVWDGYDENGTPQTSGIYFYRMRVNGKDKEIRKLILIK